jgi:hypothetical protein
MKKFHAQAVDRCVFCAYLVEATAPDGRIEPAPLAVEVVETPNGPRALCERHARDAVRKGDPMPEGSHS